MKRGVTKKIIIAIIALLFVAVVVLLVRGNIYIGVKNPTQSITKRYTVCDTSVVNQFNKIVDNTTDYNSQVNDLKNLVSNIQSKAHWSSDPTCQYISMQYEQTAGQYSKMNSNVDAIKKAADEGSFVDSRLSSLGLSAKASSSPRSGE